MGNPQKISIKAIMTGAVKYKPYVLLSATSINSELTLSMCIRGNKEEEIVAKIFSLMDKNIETLSSKE